MTKPNRPQGDAPATPASSPTSADGTSASAAGTPAPGAAGTPAPASGAHAAAPEAPAADPRRWRALGVLALALAMIVLDGSIVSVALPDIVRDLDLGLTDAQWVNSLYAVVFSALLLLSGRLGDRRGRRTLLLIGVVVFVGASVLAGLAGSGATLILARLAQGVGGALIMPSTLSTVNATFRGRERAAAFGVWGAVMAGAAALGPLLGGALTSYLSWRWIFFVNIPLGVLVILGAAAWVANTRSEHERGGLDGFGALLSGGALGLLVFGIIESSSLGWWQQKAPLNLFGAELSGPAGLSLVPFILLAGALLLTAFVLHERREMRAERPPLLDLSLFSIPTFAWGSLTAGTVAIGQFALLFTLPLYLVNARDLDVLTAGVVLAAMAGGAFVAGSAARHLAARLGAAGTVILGLVLEVIGVGVLGLVLDASTPLWLIALVLVVYGIGQGLASAQLTSTVLADVPTDASGQGSAAQSTVRQLGTALGAAIAGTLLSIGLEHGAADFTGRTAQLAKVVTDSAGSALPGLRAQHVPAPVVSELVDLFCSASRLSVLGSGTFLLLGLVGAVQVARVARAARTSAPSASGSAADAS